MAIGLVISLIIATGLVFSIIALERRDRAAAMLIEAQADLTPAGTASA